MLAVPESTPTVGAADAASSLNPRRPGLLATVAAFVRLGRPVFLGGGAILYGLGAAVARAQGHPIDLRRYLLGQVVVTAFQLMTHYANDYFDYEADRANRARTRWSGGSGVLAAGELPRAAALWAALLLAAFGLALTALLGARAAAPWAVPVGVAMFAFSWAYSAPPVRLHSTGLGEIDVALVVTGLVPLLGYLLQATAGGAGLRLLALALLPPALLQVAMILAVEFPDARSDAETGKRTLAVRLGVDRAARLYVGLLAAAYLQLPLLVLAGLPAPVAAAAALPAPLALWRILRVVRGDHRQPPRFAAVAFWSVALLAGTAAAELIAFVALRPPLP
jgi:1,4-dihydroxy-2-naphthoate polyprenyltransferase